MKIVLNPLFLLVLFVAFNSKAERTLIASNDQPRKENDQADEIKSFVQINRNDVRACHKALLESTPNLSRSQKNGKVVLEWNINEQGKVLNAKIIEAKSDLKDPILTQCLITAISKWHFEKVKAKKNELIAVKFPFVFGQITPSE